MDTRGVHCHVRSTFGRGFVKICPVLVFLENGTDPTIYHWWHFALDCLDGLRRSLLEARSMKKHEYYQFNTKCVVQKSWRHALHILAFRCLWRFSSKCSTPRDACPCDMLCLRSCKHDSWRRTHYVCVWWTDPDDKPWKTINYLIMGWAVAGDVLYIIILP